MPPFPGTNGGAGGLASSAAAPVSAVASGFTGLAPGLRSAPAATPPSPPRGVGYGAVAPSGYVPAASGPDRPASEQEPPAAGAAAAITPEGLIGIDEVQKALNRSRASVYRYTNTDPRNLNPPFNPRKLNPEYRSDQKDPLLFHPHEVARFARDVLRIKEVTVEVLNSPSTATQQLLTSILDELRAIRSRLDAFEEGSAPLPAPAHRDSFDQARPAA
jgi:hypothetical protein